MPAKPKPAFPNPAARLPGELDILANVLVDLSDHDAKLVYADWLEEREDRRGPLLRNFITAYRAGKRLPAVKSAPKSWCALVGLPLMAKLRATALAPLANTILALAQPAITLGYERAPEHVLAVGSSKFGGRPDLPAGAKWPEYEDEPLTFLAQFNLADLRASPVARELPAAGLLSLFCLYDYGEDFEEGNWRLLFFPDAAGLLRHDQHPDLPEEYQAASARLVFTEAPTLPHPESLLAKKLMRAIRAVDPKGTDYQDLRDGMGGDALLGHPCTFEGDVLGKKSVRHLLTVGDNSGNGWWPDGNMMYVTIPQDALKQGRFDRAKATLQCF
jgi:uncharacterized protein (TIGR02996 family)